MMTSPSLPRRFYKMAHTDASGLILLDGQPVRTPLKAELRLPTAALAEAIALEWQWQGERIDPRTMPLTRLANTAIDRGEVYGTGLRDDMAAYAAHDLICYRSSGPEELVERQSAIFDPILNWAEKRFGATFAATQGIGSVPQPDQGLLALRQGLEAMTLFQLVALHDMTTLSGSAFVALMVAAEDLSAEQGWAAASLDEAWSGEKWGEDAEARERLEARRSSFLTAVAFYRLSSLP